jgi:hypothetical protein
MNNNHTLTEREEVELMLPWYETGQLTAEETQLVENYLGKDAELRRMLELIREEAGETVVANERIGMPSHEARDRLMAQIAAEGGSPQKARGVVSGWLKQLGLGGVSPGLALGGALAALVIIVQAAVITSMISGDPSGEGPQLASGEDTVTEGGTFALIRFTEDASAAAITELLRENGITIVDGPKPGGMFRVKLSDETLTEDRQGALMENLRQQADLVAFVSPTR